ncbi:GntR family transcriptional regulator [uncultured Alsobacter sp.]|uniref:GntR family transcriptional regulator n=1 Tax=uncultured Alsobacter sp. TaxID=1748258 RepID=UPI0025FB3211|nr:GntR family transcriptional regulator [uncultured Alsobacter sp.]
MRPRDAVYSTLKRRILLNELKPETGLTELGVAQELGCSQGTVREALLRLQEDGLVLRNGHRGTMVTPLEADEAEEMLALRRRLETRGAMRAAARCQRDDVTRLQALLADMEEAARAGDDYGLIEIDTAFHMAIFRIAGLRSLDQILQRCILHSHRQKLWEPRHQRPLVETARRHQPLIAALDKGGESLAQALGHHIDTIVAIAPERLAV